GHLSVRQGGRARPRHLRGLRRFLGQGHAAVRADEKVTRPIAFVRRLAACVVMLAALGDAAPAHSQTGNDSGEIRGLKLGLTAAATPVAGFGEFACGSNGGAPRLRLEDWSEFARCRPEANGLHEVYARFDDEREYIDRAVEDPRYGGVRGGTRLSGHAVVLSALFDAGGILRALRFVTDPRAPAHERRMAHMFRLTVLNRYGPAGWSGTDFAPAEGETPVGGIFVKQRCEKATPERLLTVEAHFLRKPGQADLDPVTGEYRPGQFESWTRFEIFDPSYGRR